MPFCSVLFSELLSYHSFIMVISLPSQHTLLPSTQGSIDLSQVHIPFLYLCNFLSLYMSWISGFVYSSSPTEIMAAPKIDSQHNLITIHFNILEMREQVFGYASVNYHVLYFPSFLKCLYLREQSSENVSYRFFLSIN